MPWDGLSPAESRVSRRPPSRARLGEMLIAEGAISQHQLDQALSRKTASGLRIGEELVAGGLLSSDRLARALKAQRKLVLAALFGAIFGPAQAADTRAYLSVSAHVVDTVGIRSLHQAQDIVISAADIERGYVEIAGASLLEVKNTRPSLFEFRSIGRLFDAVHVSGAAIDAHFGAQGGRSSRNRIEPASLESR